MTFEILQGHGPETQGDAAEEEAVTPPSSADSEPGKAEFEPENRVKRIAGVHPLGNFYEDHVVRRRLKEALLPNPDAVTVPDATEKAESGESFSDSHKHMLFWRSQQPCKNLHSCCAICESNRMHLSCYTL